MEQGEMFSDLALEQQYDNMVKELSFAKKTYTMDLYTALRRLEETQNRLTETSDVLRRAMRLVESQEKIIADLKETVSLLEKTVDLSEELRERQKDLIFHLNMN